MGLCVDGAQCTGCLFQDPCVCLTSVKQLPHTLLSIRGVHASFKPRAQCICSDLCVPIASVWNMTGISPRWVNSATLSLQKSNSASLYYVEQQLSLEFGSACRHSNNPALHRITCTLELLMFSLTNTTKKYNDGPSENSWHCWRNSIYIPVTISGGFSLHYLEWCIMWKYWSPIWSTIQKFDCSIADPTPRVGWPRISLQLLWPKVQVTLQYFADLARFKSPPWNVFEHPRRIFGQCFTGMRMLFQHHWKGVELMVASQAQLNPTKRNLVLHSSASGGAELIPIYHHSVEVNCGSCI